jgi:PiT family inorganic phosphate transporter
MDILLLIAVMVLAATNGANDNFKGVAGLYGSRRASYATSLAWASATTLAGSLCSVFFAHTLLTAFTGAGLVPTDIAAQTRFALAVAGGGALTVGLAAWRGLPISTTHALVGAMAGAGLVAAGRGVHFSTLGGSFLLPLLVSPLIAIVPAMVLAPLLRRWAARKEAPACICTLTPTMRLEGAALIDLPTQVISGTVVECETIGARPIWRLAWHRLEDVALLVLGGMVSFARGLNDTPKIAALLLPVAMLDGRSSLAVLTVGLAMLLGGVIGARRVARTISDRITHLDVGAGLAAGLVTSVLVGTASFNGLPVSTTHVSVGAVAGAGQGNGVGIDRNVMSAIVSSWLVTLPLAAIFGALFYACLH